jgi:hypothetical protein
MEPPPEGRDWVAEYLASLDRVYVWGWAILGGVSLVLILAVILLIARATS